ncbi:MAG: hypothetical protein LLG01_19130 [Planctomycetaceae bacterium]|nr:hypothetical protein [Planctomycetaceae bacterium]
MLRLGNLWVAAVAVVPILALASDGQEARPIVGAIRWDAWTGGDVTAQVERTLGPRQFHHRLPWFASVAADGRVHIDGGGQAIMDQEIAFAAKAGLDYWAFLLYPKHSSMSVSLANYLKSKERGRINFCAILHNSFGVAEKDWPTERWRAVALLKEKGYQTVLGGRPLVYAFDQAFLGGLHSKRFADFLRAARQEGLNPYCIYMGWHPPSDYFKASAKGFDAVSAYACPSDKATFADLCQVVEKGQWRAAMVAKVPYVPLVTTGWDKRPRQENRVPSWEKGQNYVNQKVFPAAGTPEEIVSHLQRAIALVRVNKAICPAQAVIVYAWNEHDEGGWLCPTWTSEGKPNTERIEALSRALKK